MKYTDGNTVLKDEANIQIIRDLVADDISRVNTLIQEKLHSDVALIDQLGHYIVNSGGKRLRPTLLLLSTGVFSYAGEKHIELAAIIEFIHTATLLHDDVVDASLLRRGKATANQRWGNEASVLVGDFLYSRSFQMMVDVGSLQIMEILSEATNTIAEGEVQQLLNRHDPETTETRYLEVIHNKTAKLFEAATHIGAVLCERSQEEEQAMANYGKHLGVAYQLIDDVLDYNASAFELGKNVGDDLAEGKPTLPLLYAMWNSSDEESRQIRTAIENGGLDNMEKILDVIQSTGAIAYTAELAQVEADKAIQQLDKLPASKYRDALYTLARFATERTY